MFSKNHMTINVHWAYVCRCKQEVKMVKSKNRDFFTQTDDGVKLLMKVTITKQILPHIRAVLGALSTTGVNRMKPQSYKKKK